MIADGLFQRFPMERIFGWHNWPGLEAGTIAVHDSAVMAAGARFEIIFEGHAGHAALPHLTRDPMIGAGHCIVALQSIVARNIDPMQAAVVSVTVAEAGEAQNQVAARATLKGTARWLTAETGEAIEAGMRRIAAGIAATFGLEAEVVFKVGVAPTVNHPAEREAAAAAAGAVTRVRRDLLPAMTGRISPSSCRRCPAPSSGSATAPARAAASCTTRPTTSTTPSCRSPAASWPRWRSGRWPGISLPRPVVLGY